MIKTMISFSLVLVILTSCHPRTFNNQSRLTTDDRAMIQDLLDHGAGGVVTIPDGEYLLGKGAGSWCIHIPDNTTVQGVSVVLRQGVVQGSVRLIDPGQYVKIIGLTLDGQRSLQTLDEHRSGIFAMNAVGLVVKNVAAHDFTGDGITIHSGTNQIELDDLSVFNNGRSGLAFTGCSTGATIRNLISHDNAVKAFHTEPGAGCSVNDVNIFGGTLDSSSSGDFALSYTGGGTAVSSGLIVTGATIIGGVYTAGVTNVLIGTSDISNIGNKPAVLIYRNSSAVTLDSNTRIISTGAPAVVEITGTDITNTPSATIINNIITNVGTVTAMGVHAISAKLLIVTGNTITGVNTISPYAYGVYARSIVPGANLDITVSGNIVRDWGSTGIIIANTGGGLSNVSVTNNTCSSVSGAERYCLNLPITALFSGNVVGAGVFGLIAP